MKPSWKLCAAFSAAAALLLEGESPECPEPDLAALVPLVCGSALPAKGTDQIVGHHCLPIHATSGLSASQQHFYDGLPIEPIVAPLQFCHNQPMIG